MFALVLRLGNPHDWVPDAYYVSFDGDGLYWQSAAKLRPIS